MKKRTITALIIVLIFAPLLIFEQMIIPFEIGVGLLALLASLELINMFEKQHELDWFVKITIVILTIGFYIIVGNVWHSKSGQLLEELSSDLSLIFMAALIVLFTLSIFLRNFDGNTLGIALLVITYLGLGFGSIVILRLLGTRYIIYVLMVTVLTDTFAFLFGVKFGKNKMAPDISPKKSWEGAIAGTVIATAFASTFAIFYGLIFPKGSFFNESGSTTILHNITSLGFMVDKTPILWQQALIIIPLTLSLSIFGQLGDLFASKLKRTYDIKDFGEIFPGHGGVLDRFDSTIFASIFLVFVFKILQTAWPWFN